MVELMYIIQFSRRYCLPLTFYCYTRPNKPDFRKKMFKMVVDIWVKFLRVYRAWIWCNIFCIFEHLFRQFRGVLHQNIQHFLKIYECQIVYIPLFWPVVHWGPVQLPIHFTLHQKIVVLQNIIYSLFSPVFVFLSHIIDRYDVQGYPVCLEGH